MSEHSDLARSFVSLFLVLHLFCLFVALTASVSPSPLQAQFLGVIRPYIRVLNFELPYSQYNLTYGREDAHYRIQILKSRDATKWYSLPDVGSRASERYCRYQRLGRRIVVLDAEEMPEIEAAAATLVQSVAEHFAARREIEDGGKLRCWRQLPLYMDSFTEGNAGQQDRNSDFNTSMEYEADVIVSSDGSVNVNKTAEEREVAQPGQGGN